MYPNVRINTTAIKIVVAIIALIVLLAMCIRVIGVGEVGVKTRFGQVVSQHNSGILLKLPWPIEKIHVFDIKTQKDQAEVAAASSDLQDVNSTIVTNFHIDSTKVGNLFSTVGTDYKARIIDPAIQESFKATTAQYAVGELVTRRSELKSKSLEVLKSRLAARGIIVEDISITNLAFSPSFTRAIEQKQVAEQQAQQARFNLDKAQIDAQAQATQKESLTPEILQKMAIEKWDGKLPQATGGNVPFINIR
ncbi:MAG TPA: prohibitin family protein [Candidatus Saccharimonadales bacterium]|jgi:regulator of protease activity HflC (stomatin/prohibitin superfamily)